MIVLCYRILFKVKGNFILNKKISYMLLQIVFIYAYIWHI